MGLRLPAVQRREEGAVGSNNPRISPALTAWRGGAMGAGKPCGVKLPRVAKVEEHHRVVDMSLIATKPEDPNHA